MAKFSSLDGVDKNGIRAEVTVQTGTGRIKEIVGRGKQNEDGSYRNVEVIFDPDNPLLKRKVYGLLDTNAAELWAYIQTALKEERTVSYRIESQRRSGVDRTLPIGELQATEQVRRILASVDAHYSHEAKTNPTEDPDNENPSALNQNIEQMQQSPRSGGSGSAGGAGMSPDQALVALATARKAGLSATVVDTLAAYALASGAQLVDVQSAGFASGETPPVGVEFASEERPWQLWNSDGRVNYGSYAVTRAAEAEQFALDHLISIYTPPNTKGGIDITDEIIAQAAAVALQFLVLADRVQVAAYGGGSPDRMKNSYARALNLVMDAVSKRYPVPVGGDAAEQEKWGDQVVDEASERLYGLGEIVHGRTPKSIEERDSVEAARVRVVTPEPVFEAPVTPEPTVPATTVEPEVHHTPAPAAPSSASEPAGVAGLMDAFGGTVLSETASTSFLPGNYPKEGDAGFEVPNDATIARLRAMCESANVAQDTRAISNWIERVLGVRSARKVHAPVLVAFCEHYERMGSSQIRSEVLGA